MAGRGLYKPGANKDPWRKGKPLNRRPANANWSAVPRGRRLQVESYLGIVTVDKAKDLGREDFAREVEELRESGEPLTEEQELYIRYANLESGDAYWLSWKPRAATVAAVNVNLSRCTEEELDAFRDAILRAVEEARPEVCRRDGEAKRAEERGFYGLLRVTRSAPHVVDFRRQGN